jgi:hypothetical protein
MNMTYLKQRSAIDHPGNDRKKEHNSAFMNLMRERFVFIDSWWKQQFK